MTQDNSKSNYDPDRPILYIMVIGFHHKKGCQLEFVYPNDSRIQKLPPNNNGQQQQHITQMPAVANNSTADTTADLYHLPKNWKHLPSLALLDGSHNYETDYIYFHLEDDDNDSETAAATATHNKKPPRSSSSKTNRTRPFSACPAID